MSSTGLTMENDGTNWLLLIHQVPNSPPYLRVKMWRRLQKIGAVPVKNAVYVLPRSDQSIEDFHWIAREILEAGGDASVCEAGFLEGLSDPERLPIQLIEPASGQMLWIMDAGAAGMNAE